MDKEDEDKSALYVLNPEYFKQSANQPAKPILMEVQSRYASVALILSFVALYL